MKCVADQNIPHLDKITTQFSMLVKKPGHAICSDDLVDADALLVRSVTQVRASLLEKAKRLTFVGSVTAGIEHIDTALLQRRNIAFACAKGSNANAVSEYVVSCLLTLEAQGSLQLSSASLGIIGVGNIGSRLAHKARALGMVVLECDPPRAHMESDFRSVSLQDALSCDCVSFHVPLQTVGVFATYHLLNAQRIQQLHSRQILMNTSRGAVWDNAALFKRQQGAHPLTLVMDVWEGEPNISRAFIDTVRIATPHIAGYSVEGKAEGSWLMYLALCQHFHWPVTLSFQELVPDEKIVLHQSGHIHETVRNMYDVRRDDRVFRDTYRGPEDFETIRAGYPHRREFSAGIVHSPANLKEVYRTLGFSLETQPPE